MNIRKITILVLVVLPILVGAQVRADICYGDVDQTGNIDFDDLVILLDLLEANDWYIEPPVPLEADVDQSGYIDFDDLVALWDLLETIWFIPCY